MDVIWEYQGPQAAKPAAMESEDILLEMERLLYEDLREELIRKGTILITSANFSSMFSLLLNSIYFVCLISEIYI
jgi:hypothetical protein